MKIVEYEAGMASDLAEVYSEAVGSVPHCYPVDGKTFSKALGAAAGGERTQDRLHSELILVGKEGRSIIGFIHAAVEDPKEKDEVARGTIRFFWYKPGRRGEGQELLAAAENYLRNLRLDRVIAFHQNHRYPFYCYKHAYLSDHLSHIQALLSMNGYQRVMGEVFLDWTNFMPVQPSPIDTPVRIELQWLKGHGDLPGLKVKASLGKKEIGTCECVSCGEFSRTEAVQDWLFTEWLAVSKEHQGQGLGRHLLRRALQEMYGAGYRHASKSTDWKNHRAFLFYSNFGYKVADWTYAFGRSLSNQPAQ